MDALFSSYTNPGTRPPKNDATSTRKKDDPTVNSIFQLKLKNEHYSSCAESGKALHEVEKSKRAIEVERNDLQAALEEAEGAIEAEESKVLRLQVELAQIKQDIDRRIREKEEENDNQRRNSQRAMESMQTTLDSEIRARAEVSRTRKKEWFGKSIRSCW